MQYRLLLPAAVYGFKYLHRHGLGSEISIDIDRAASSVDNYGQIFHDSVISDVYHLCLNERKKLPCRSTCGLGVITFHLANPVSIHRPGSPGTE